MTKMKIMTYEEFTDLNIDSNLTDFILYLNDRGIVNFPKHTRLRDIQELVKEMQQDWLEVAKEELKERNEFIKQEMLEELQK